MTSLLLDGKKISSEILDSVKTRSKLFTEKYNRKPKIALIQVGENSDSSRYLRTKHKKAVTCGFDVLDIKLPANCEQATLGNEIKTLNNKNDVDGILLQLPLPEHLCSVTALDNIKPSKDLDGLTSHNVALLNKGKPQISPCTPLGIIHLARFASNQISKSEDISGLHVVVVGRSNLVGRPTARLFELENCTVTVCHSKTTNLSEHTSKADILVVAAGIPKLITKKMIKEGVIIIDVGISYLDGALLGDVNFDDCQEIAAAITPVPGGVGPMTIAFLMQNTIDAAEVYAQH